MLQQLHAYLPSKQHLVIDFDRTIAKMEINWSDWHPGIIAIFDKYEPEHGYLEGQNPHPIYNALAKKHGKSLVDEVKQFNRNYEKQYLEGFTPNNQLIDFIKNNNSHKLYVYSSNSRPTVLKGLDELSISDAFDQVISKDEVTYVKPNPEGFYLINDFNENKDHFLMIGDSGSDRDAAKAAGIDFLECNVFEKYFEEE